MGVTIGMPCLKLNNAGRTSKHCGDFKKVAEEALAERHGRDSDINQERTKDNVLFGYKTAAELIAYSDKHVREMTETLRKNEGRGIRCDAVRMCVIIIKPPAVWIEGLSREKQLQFFNDSLKKIKEIVGEENVKAVAIHFDELAPHMHVFWEPMTPDGRLCAKDMHGLRFLGNLNREMPKYLRSKGWEIDDCNAYDAAEEQKKKATLGKEEYQKYLQDKRAKNGRDSFKFKAQIEAEKEELIRTVSVEKTKTVKSVFGRNKEVKKTKSEIEFEQLILLAQSVLRDKEKVENYKKELQELKDNEEVYISKKAEEIAERMISKRELEAIRSENIIKDKLVKLESIISQNLGMSLDDFIIEITKQNDPKTIIKERRKNHEKYREQQ